MTFSKARLLPGIVRGVLLSVLLVGSSSSVLAQPGDSTAEGIEISLRGGQVKRVEVNLGTDPRPDLDLRARLSPGESRNDGLRIELLSRDIAFDPDGRKLVLEVAAERQCCLRSYDATVVVDAGGTAGHSVVLPLKVQVKPSAACVGSWAGFGAFLFAVWYYTRAMYFHCSFLSASQLASRLKPRKPNDTKGHESEVKASIEAQLRFGPRFRAWLRANPLVFALPGKRYKEAVRLDLGRKNHSDIVLDLVGIRDPYSYFQNHPNEAKGKLFAIAQEDKGTLIYGLTGPDDKIGTLKSNKPLKVFSKVPAPTYLSNPANDGGPSSLESWCIN